MMNNSNFYDWYQPRRPRYHYPSTFPVQQSQPYPSTIPVEQFQPKAATNNSRPSRKIVSVPVQFVSSESMRSESALKIQNVFRGYIARCRVKQVAALKREVDEVEARISSSEIVEILRRDEKERLRLNERLMSLLLKLDSVRGTVPGVRECRKTVIKKAIALQERIDAIVDASISDESLEMTSSMEEIMSNGSCDAQAEGDEEVRDDDSVKSAHKEQNSSSESPSTVDVPVQPSPMVETEDGHLMKKKDGSDTEEEGGAQTKEEGIPETKEEGIPETEEEGRAETEEEGGAETDEKGRAETEEEGLAQTEDKGRPETEEKSCDDDCLGVAEGNPSSGDGVEQDGVNRELNKMGEANEEAKTTQMNNCRKKMGEDNEKVMMKHMMAKLLESNDLQMRMVRSLTERVEQLERALLCEKLKKQQKKMRQCAGAGAGAGAGHRSGQWKSYC